MRIEMRWMFRAVACLPALLLPGCAPSQLHVYELDIPAASQGLAIDVENFRGEVIVRADGQEDYVTIKSRIQTIGADNANVEYIYDGVSIDSEMIEMGGRSVLKVRSTSERADKPDHSVKLFISAPSCEGVRVLNEGGLVEVVESSGTVFIQNVEGPVEFRTSHPIVDPVTITTVNANIYYQVPPESTGLIDMLAIDGLCRYRDKKGGSSDTFFTPDSLRTVLNEGDNPVVFRTTYGEIRVLVMEDPVELTRTFRKSAPNLYEKMHRSGSRHFTRNLDEEDVYPAQ